MEHHKNLFGLNPGPPNPGPPNPPFLPIGCPNSLNPIKSRTPGFSSTPWLSNGSMGSNLAPGGRLGSYIFWGFEPYGFKGLPIPPLPLKISFSGPIY